MMDSKMKIVMTALILLCMSHITLASSGSEIRTTWPGAITFSKLQMTRLDVVDPSYEIRLKNIRSTSPNGPFSRWESLISQSL